MQACEKFGWYNRNAAVNPYLVEGNKTGGMEIAEQCMNEPPDWISVSVGDGCTIWGIHKGLVTMKQMQLIDWSARMLGVQAAGVDPVARTFHGGEPLDRPGGGETYADSINCPVPRNWRKAVIAAEDSGGTYVTVTDEEIREAVRLTGRLAGVFAEPAAAAAIAGIAAARCNGVLDEKSSVVAVISGSGLKDLDGAMSAVGEPYTIKSDIHEVEKIVSG
jgi:threonine synthase